MPLLVKVDTTTMLPVVLVLQKTESGIQEINHGVCMPFEAGRLKNYIENWRKITSDPVIAYIVEHCHIECLPGCDPVNSNTKFCIK